MIAAGLAAAALGSGGMARATRSGLVIAALALVGGYPLVAALGALAALGAALRRARHRRLAAGEDRSDLIRLADLLVLGLSSGLTPAGALREAAPDLSEPMRTEIELLLRRAATSGISSVLATWEGRGERLFRLMARAVLTGAPLVGAVEAFASERRHEQHTRALATTRRLPVKLLVPLALLILPGFVILIVGPALARSLARLDIVP